MTHAYKGGVCVYVCMYVCVSVCVCTSDTTHAYGGNRVIQAFGFELFEGSGVKMNFSGLKKGVVKVMGHEL